YLLKPESGDEQSSGAFPDCPGRPKGQSFATPAVEHGCPALFRAPPGTAAGNPCAAGLRVPPDRRLAVARRAPAHSNLSNRRNLNAARTGRRTLTMGAAAGSILAATLTFAVDQAHAAYTAQVKAGTLQIRGDGASDKLLLAPTPTTLVLDVGE